MKAAAYARYSTNMQTDNSIAYQFNAIQKYCAENNMDICAYYSDEAQSGTNINRQGFIDIVADAALKKFDAVVIYDISRGSRDVADWFEFRKTMRRFNVEVISVENTLGDILNPNDFLTELISVGLGQHAVLSTRQKSIAGMAERAKKGVFCGGNAPLGYDIVDGNYVINEKEAEYVRLIFTMYGQDKSYSNIIDALNGAKGKLGKPIGKNSLFSILNNERYIGTYTWNKQIMRVMKKWAGGKPNPNCIRIENVIPPIIDNDLWERVQTRLKDNKKMGQFNAKKNYLLSGLIECAECGSTYVGHTSTNSKGYSTSYYICGNKYRTRTCHAKNINANVIETFVVQNLKHYLDNADFDEVATKIADAVNSASRDLNIEKKELADVIIQINNGTRAILKGIDYPELQIEIDSLRIRKSELEDIIAHNANNHKKVSKDKIVQMFKSSADNLDSQTKEVIKYHITKIYANTDGTFSVNVGVHLNVDTVEKRFLIFLKKEHPVLKINRILRRQ